MALHELKTWPEPFAAVLDGMKRFEIRKNDRDFKRNDLLRLREWSPLTGKYTGRETTVGVTYIIHGPAWDIPEGVCVMSIEEHAFAAFAPKAPQPIGLPSAQFTSEAYVCPMCGVRGCLAIGVH